MKIIVTLLRAVAYAAGGILLFILLVVLFIQTGFFKEQARVIAVDQVRRHTGATLRLGRIGGNFITGITLTEVELNVDNRLFASAERISVTYFLPALLQNTVLAYRVQIEGLKGHLLRDESRQWNFNKLGPPGPRQTETAPKKPGGTPLSIFAREVTIERGTIVMEDIMTEGSRRSVEGLNITASFSMTSRKGKNRFALSLRRLSFRSSNPALTLVNLRGSASLSDGNAVFDNLSVELPGSRGRVHGTITGIPAPVYDLRADFPRIAAGDIRRLLPGLALEGELATYLSLQGPLNALKASYRLRYRALHLRTEALINAKESCVSLQSAIRDFRPQDILPFCGVGVPQENCITGNVSLDLSVSARRGRGTLPAVDAHLAVLPSVINRTLINGATVDFSLEDERIAVSSGTVETSSGAFAIAGDGLVLGFFAPGKPVDARLAVGLRNVDVSAFLRQPAPASDINGTVRATFVKPAREPFNRMTIAGTVAFSSSSFGGIPVRSADIRAEYDGGVIAIGDCRIRSDIAEISAAGNIDIRNGLDVRYRVTAADIGALSKLAPKFEGAGRLEIAGNLRGTVRAPVLLASLRGNDLRYASLGAGTLSAEINVRNAGKYPAGAVRLDVQRLTVGGTAVEQVRITADSRGNAVAVRTDIVRDNERRYFLAGSLSGLDKTVKTVRLDVFRLSASTVSWAAVAPLEARWSDKGVEVVSFDIANGDQRIALGGTVMRSAPLDFFLNVSSADVADIGRLIGTQVPLAGKLSCAFQCRGSALSPVATGYVILRQGGAGGFAFDLLAGELRYRNRQAYFDLVLDRDQRRLLAAGGTVPVDLALNGAKTGGMPGLAVTVRSRNLDPALLSAFVQGVEKAAGNVSLDLSLTGTVAHPDVRGKIAIDHALLRLSSLGTDYSDINGRISIGSGTVVVEQLSLRSGGGRADISGNMSFRDFVPLGTDVTLVCRRFKVMDSSLFSGNIDADLRLAGPVSRSSLTGGVTVLDSTINIPSDTRKQVKEIQIVGTTGAGGRVVERAETQTPLFSNLVINVDVHVPGNTWVKGRGVNAELSGKLAFRKEQDRQPFIIGRIETVRGTYVLRGRTLKVDRGIITFTGTRQLDADLDVMASGQVANVTIIVRVGGTLTKPELSLSSQPPMDESDILAYLIFGKPTNRLTQTEGRIVQSTAVQVIGNIAAKSIKEVLGRQLAPDVFDIVSTGTERGVAVGKYLTERLFVRYEWRQGIEEVTQTMLDYQISRHFSIHSQVGYEPTAGADIFWTVNY